MSSRTVPRAWLADAALAVARGPVLAAVAAAGAGLLAFLVGPLALIAYAVHRATQPGSGHLLQAAVVAVSCTAFWLVLLPSVLLVLRPLANLTRRLSGKWCGIPIEAPYRPSSAGAPRTARLRWLVTDRATWRDLLWVIVNAVASPVLLLLPAIGVGVGLIAFLGSRVIATIPPPAYPGNTTPSILIIGCLLVAAGLLTGPWFLRGFGVVARSLLAPSGQAALAQRVRQLSQTRAEAIDAGAAEIRRIERDLHDGAQARLVAMGMTLDAAGQLINENPQAAQALLLEARDNSVKALKELRDLVRGIHPPVLADRGLADAIKALALDTPLRTHVASDLAGRPPAPVESAAYFAVSELLANVAKHAQARQAWIDVSHAGGMLKIGVIDDGTGGADPDHGTGLRGIERRLAAFDGVLAVSSPPGGPTAVNVEIPCELDNEEVSR